MSQVQPPFHPLYRLRANYHPALTSGSAENGNTIQLSTNIPRQEVRTSYDVDLDVTTRIISSSITQPFTLLSIHPGPSCQRRTIRRRRAWAIGTSTSARTETEATALGSYLDLFEGLGTNPAWHTLDRPNRPSHRRETRTTCSCTPVASQDLKIPGHSQVLFYCHGIPGASVKWESSKDHHSIQAWRTVASSDKGQNPPLRPLPIRSLVSCSALKLRRAETHCMRLRHQGS